ncbi:two-component response regulator 24 [Rosa chinensis]|uniref:two-component response regulator 24 n=1 Tax=Rosa chinensis TaxID=74649 RepID=UPI000D091CCE|nr:two-component response regulator 24 [Rosa chinensis]
MADGNANGNQEGATTPLMSWNNNLKALLVDPSPACRLIGKAYLTAYGVNTEAVDNADVAIILLNMGASFNVILIDMHMREMNGAQFAMLLRSLGVQTKLLGMSTMFREREKEEFLEAGGDGFIEKPLHPSKFVPILQELDSN